MPCSSFLGVFFFQWYAKETFTFFWRVLHLSAQECHTLYFIYFYSLFKASCVLLSAGTQNFLIIHRKVQGCALRKIEGSPVLWNCKIKGAQHMICMKKLRFPSRPGGKVRRQGPPGSARAQPWSFLLFSFLVFIFCTTVLEFSYFIYFILYLKLLLFYFWQDRYSKFPFDLQKIFLFFFFRFAHEMKYFVWTWFSTTISISNLSMWIKSFFFLQASVRSYLTIHQCFYVLVSDYSIVNFISQH